MIRRSASPDPDTGANVALLDLSLNELQALCRKAARGAGFDWGSADEVGLAVRYLAAHDLPGAQSLRLRLSRHAHDARELRAFAPRSLDGVWRSESGTLCALLAGIALSDVAARLPDLGEIVLHDVFAPLLLLPFAARATERIGMPVSIGWADLTLTDDGGDARLLGNRARIRDETAATVLCRAGGTASGAALARRARAPLDPACVADLERFAHRTYAPATDASRLRGAGGAQADDV